MKDIIDCLIKLWWNDACAHLRIIWSIAAPSRDALRAHHVLQLNPSTASSRRNCFTSQERLVKTYKIDVKKIKLSGNIEPEVKKRIRVGLLENTSGPSAFPSLQRAVGSLFPLETGHIWSAPYTLTLDHWRYLHIHRLYNSQERVTHSCGSSIPRVWWVYHKCSSIYTDTDRHKTVWPISSRSLCLQIMYMHCAHDTIWSGGAQSRVRA